MVGWFPVGVSSSYLAQQFFQFFIKPSCVSATIEAIAYSCGLIGGSLRKLSKEVQQIIVPTYIMVGFDDKQNLIGKEAVTFADGGESFLTGW